MKLNQKEKNLLIILLYDEKHRQEKMLKKYKNDEDIKYFLNFIEKTIDKLNN